MSSVKTFHKESKTGLGFSIGVTVHEIQGGGVPKCARASFVAHVTGFAICYPVSTVGRALDLDNQGRRIEAIDSTSGFHCCYCNCNISLVKKRDVGF